MLAYWNLQLAGTGREIIIPKEDLEVQILLLSMSGHDICLIKMNQRFMKSIVMLGWLIIIHLLVIPKDAPLRHHVDLTAAYQSDCID
jgi:hypothetical protein